MDRIAFPPERSGNAAPLPPVAPMAMPVQNLRRFRRPPGRRPPFRWGVFFARLVLFAATLVLTGLLAREMYLVLSVGELVAIEIVMLVLFVLNIGWICFGAVSTVIGLFAPPPRVSEGVTGAPKARTALLLPIYNEDPTHPIATARATLLGLRALGVEGAFDLFVLSDTNKADVWLAEQGMIEAARADPEIAAHLFYRHRLRNRERKVGNIGDWVERWGGAYEFMLVLDADSLMEAGTILELARRMEADPSAGLIQTVPRLVNGRTVLARLQQFASRVYGPLLARGLRVWFGDAGNYWGHNAIIRTEAFAGSCGLPILRGRKPFGGLILSHDFVEAGLIRREGWAVLMADDLEGSYEQAPPNLIELVSRDRRWCQGNLQHLGLLGTAGLHPISRLHLAMGAMSYLASPLWFLFLLAGMLLALHASLVPPNYFPEGWSLFPTWPQIDARRAMMLFGLCMFVLYLPKLLGFIAFLGDPGSRGVRWRAIPGFIVENLLSALIAPILMLTQTRSVLQILTGRDSGWNAQARDSTRIPWADLWMFHRRHTLVGLILAVTAGLISWSLLAWMSPALIGLGVSIPLAALVSSRGVGDWLRRRGVMVTPEEVTPPAIVLEADAAAQTLAATAQAPESVPALLADHHALRRHLGWLDLHTQRRPGEPDPTLAAGWLKLTDGIELEKLTPGELYALIASGKILRKFVATKAVVEEIRPPSIARPGARG